jgi:polyphosphate glucokinase
MILGIDVGASGIKGGMVDTTKGELVGERFRVEMPKPSTPTAVADAILQIKEHFAYQGPIGIGFPSVVKNGFALSAANIHESWIGVNIETLFSEVTGCPIFAANDADVAGLAEMRFGHGMGLTGTVVLITIGTGLGTAVFFKGMLLPNTELGHIRLEDGIDAEKYASNAAQKREDLSLKKWAKRFNKYLTMMEQYLQPDLFILGGGTSRHFEEFKHKIEIATKVVPAKLYNNAGIVGAAIYAAEQ